MDFYIYSLETETYFRHVDCNGQVIWTGNPVLARPFSRVKANVCVYINHLSNVKIIPENEAIKKAS